jgi:cytochrome P450
MRVLFRSYRVLGIGGTRLPVRLSLPGFQCCIICSCGNCLLGYNITTPPGVSGSLLMLSEPAEHSKRRRTWERAFTPSAIRSYNSLLHTRVHELVANLASLSSSAEDVKKIDLTQWLTYMSMDFMGDFAYGGAFSFGTTHSDPEGFNDILHKTLRTVEIVATIPWIRPILVAMPPKATMKFRTVAAGVAERRKEKGSEYRDLFHHLVRTILAVATVQGAHIHTA